MSKEKLLKIKEEFKKYYETTDNKDILLEFDFKLDENKENKINAALEILNNIRKLPEDEQDKYESLNNSLNNYLNGVDDIDNKSDIEKTDIKKEYLNTLYEVNKESFDIIKTIPTYKNDLNNYFGIDDLYDSKEEREYALDLVNRAYEIHLNNQRDNKRVEIKDIRNMIDGIRRDEINLGLSNNEISQSEQFKINDLKSKLHEKNSERVFQKIREENPTIIFEEIYDLHKTFLDFNEYLYFNNLIDAGIKNEFHSRMIEIDNLRDLEQYEINENLKKVMFSDMSYDDIGKYMTETNPFKSPFIYSALWQEHKENFYNSKDNDYKRLPKYSDIEKVDNLPNIEKTFNALNSNVKDKNFINNSKFLKDTDEVLETLDKNYNINYEDLPSDSLGNIKNYLNFIKLTEDGVKALPNGMINKSESNFIGGKLEIFENHCTPELQRNITFLRIMKNEIDSDNDLLKKLKDSIKSKEGYYSVKEYNEADEENKIKIIENSKLKISNETDLSKSNFNDNINNLLLQVSDNLFTEDDKVTIKKLIDENNFEKLDDNIEKIEKLFNIKKTFIDSSNLNINNMLMNKNLSGDKQSLKLDDNLESLAKNKHLDFDKARATFMKHMKEDLKKWASKPDGFEGFLYRFGSKPDGNIEKLGLSDIMIPTYVIKDMFILLGNIISLVGLFMKIAKEESQNRETLAKLRDINKIKEKFGESSSQFKEETKYAMDILKNSKHAKEFEKIDLNKEINGGQIAYAISKLEEVSRKNITNIDKIINEISQYDTDGLERALDKTNTKDIFLSSMRIYNTVLDDKQSKIDSKNFNDYGKLKKPVVNRDDFNKIIYNFRNDEKIFPEMLIMLKETNKIDSFFDFIKTSKNINPHDSQILLNKISNEIIKDFIDSSSDILDKKINNNNEVLSRILKKDENKLDEMDKVTALSEIRNCVGNDILIDIIKTKNFLPEQIIIAEDFNDIKSLIEKTKNINISQSESNELMNKIKVELLSKDLILSDEQLNILFDKNSSKNEIEKTYSELKTLLGTQNISLLIPIDRNISSKMLFGKDFEHNFSEETSLHDIANNMYIKHYKITSDGNPMEINNNIFKTIDLFPDFKKEITSSKDWMDKYSTSNYLFSNNYMDSIKDDIKVLINNDKKFKEEFGTFKLSNSEVNSFKNLNLKTTEEYVSDIKWNNGAIKSKIEDIEINLKNTNYNNDQINYLNNLKFILTFKQEINKINTLNINDRKNSFESINNSLVKKIGSNVNLNKELDSLKESIYAERTNIIKEIANAPIEIKNLENKKSIIQNEMNSIKLDIVDEIKILEKDKINNQSYKLAIEEINKVINSNYENKLNSIVILNDMYKRDDKIDREVKMDILNLLELKTNELSELESNKKKIKELESQMKELDKKIEEEKEKEINGKDNDENSFSR